MTNLNRSKKKIVALLSSGLDSTVNAFDAIKHGHEVVLALTFNYGQRAAQKEIEQSKKIAAFLNIPHKVIDLTWFKEFNKSSLIVEEQLVPVGSQIEIDDIAKSNESAKSVWVPNRNGIFINIAAAFAEALGAGSVLPGFNAEEAVTFPDNSIGFMEQATRALAFSTANHVTVECSTAHLQKTEIVRLGQDLKVPWDLIWPCYFAGQSWCGECESCLRAKRAFHSAAIELPGLFIK